MNEPPRASLFRRTRRNQRSRLGLDNPEALTFTEPEHVDFSDWNRALLGRATSACAQFVRQYRPARRAVI